MIPRYSRSEMAAHLDAGEPLSHLARDRGARLRRPGGTRRDPASEAARAVWERGGFEVARIDEIERETKHDVIAFLTNLAEHVGPEARFVHQGMTSSDVLDTCLAVQLSRAADILLADIDAMLAALKRRAFEHKLTPCIGRSHGIHAEPTTFGLKLAGFYAEWRRNRERLTAARREIATCAISGAVGTFANIDPRVEAACRREAGARGRAGLDAGDPARPARRCSSPPSASSRAGIERLGDRDPPPAAHGGAARPRSISRRGRRAPRRCRTSATRS